MNKIHKSLAAVFASMFAFGAAANAQGIAVKDANYNNIVLSGEVPADQIGKGFVTFVIKDGEEVKYVDQTKIENGKYFAKFKYDKPITDDTKISVKVGSQDVSSGIISVEAHNDIDSSLELIGTGTNRYVDADDDVKLSMKLQNVWWDDIPMSLYLAFYDENGAFLDVNTTKTKMGFGTDGAEQNILSSYIGVPQNTATVKGFAWADNLKPLAKLDKLTVGDKSFQNGDRVAFVGDSITHIGLYPEFIEHYYQTRYPENDYVFLNKGISGQRASNVPERLERDIFSEDVNRITLMFGANDTRDPYRKNSTIDVEKTLDEVVANFENIIKKCKEKGIEVSIITTTPVDDGLNSTMSDTDIADLAAQNEGLKQLSTRLKTLGKTYDIAVYDVNSRANEIISERRKVDSTGQIFTGNDRLHLTNSGSVLAGYCFLTEQGVDGLVASTNVNAQTGGAVAKNAVISNVNITQTGGSFTYAPKSIPLAYSSDYKSAETNDATITQKLNREMLSVTDLADGDYTVSLNGVTTGTTYTAEQLKNGINIATLDANPNQAKAKENYSMLQAKNEISDDLRSIALAESFGATAEMVTDTEAFAEFIARQQSNAYINTLNNYPTLKSQESELRTRLEEMRQDAKALVQPQTYTVSIISAN